MPVTKEGSTLLEELARRYIWWKSIQEAIVYPERIIAQVMDIGDYGDVQRISDELGEDFLRRVLRQAEIGRSRPGLGHTGTIVWD
jgi:hypothetical protein